MRIALFEPDIPQNTGTILRLGACFGMPVDVIEPCGFAFSDTKFKRAGMDYIDQVEIERHSSWAQYKQFAAAKNLRLLLLTTKSPLPYTDFKFSENDVLLLGRESSGVPQEVHDYVAARLTVPIKARSLNVAIAAAIVAGEAARQLNIFAKP